MRIYLGMISILTLTYKRKDLLEEAIQSYLLQIEGHEDTTEMVIINDVDGVEYVYNHPNIRIINLKERFSSVGKKLEWGFKQCKYPWIYRLDDDDLLSPFALNLLYRRIYEYPNKDILRDVGHYVFTNNKYQGINGSVNNGNCYSSNFIKRVGPFIDAQGEDSWLTFDNKADTHTYKELVSTMIYRWGMGVYHISGMGNISSEEVNELTDNQSDTEMGTIEIVPNFKNDYWSPILNDLKKDTTP